MKRFLTLLILTGLLFGQDVLYLKSGELKKGVFIEKIDNDIVFQIEGESKYTRFSIDLVEIIETNNRAIFYPFDIPIDIPTKKDNPSFGQDILNLKSGESFEGTFYEKLGRDILFKAVGDTTTKKFLIWDIETIVTKNWGELTYPFDIPIDILTKQAYPSWSEGYSIGYSSEKIAISFYNLSLLLNIDEHSELFGTFTSIIFVSGIGLGYKYYIMGKSKSSPFISVSAQNYFSDDFLPEEFSPWTAAGVSLRKTGGKASFNIGILKGFNIGILKGITFDTPIVPFLNLEVRFR